jgi:CDP-glycerol glycerophosphotransferase (TagB/SpsB family)
MFVDEGYEQYRGFYFLKSSILFNESIEKKQVIINNLYFDSSNNLLTFSLSNEDINLFGSKILLIERSSNIEWIEDIYSENLDTNRAITINLNKFAKNYYNQNSRWDFYLITLNSIGIYEKLRLGTFDQEVAPKHKRYLSSTSTEGVNLVTPYLTNKNELSLVIIEPKNLEGEKINVNMKITKFRINKNIIDGMVSLQLPEVHSFLVKSLVLKYRSKTDNIEYKFSVSEEKKNKTTCKVTFSFDISQLEFQNYYWDFYLVIQIDKKESLIRFKNPSMKVKKTVNKQSIKQSYIYENGFWIQPYITAFNSISLLYKKKELHETPSYFLKEKLAYYFYLLFKWYFDQKNIWLAFEKFSNSAQDNGFYFFKYCHDHGKKENFYYILKEDSPDYSNVLPLKNKVIHFMSFKYMVYLFAAKLLISSETKGHAYDIRVQKGLLRKAIKYKRQVFLQHGVIALKRVDQVFKKTSNNAADLFVVSSEYEKNIIKSNFGYKDNEIIVTGLSRWDVLKDQSKGQSTILLMPTWRSWMDDLSEKKFMETEYYKQYTSLLNSHYLEEVLEQYDIKLNFFIHPKFKAYIDKFSSTNKRIKIYQYGEEKLNQLLMRSSMLITDYSSVSWDMYYQKKPIIFYQFDLEDYIKYQGSYINMETELFGDRVFKADQLVDLIKKYADQNYNENPKYALMREEYFKYTDQNNSSRIYQEIMNNAERLTKKKYYLALYDSPIIRTLWGIAKKYKICIRFADQLRRKINELYR